MPLEPGPVRLLSVMIDASFHESNEGAGGASTVIADVQAVYRVHNRDKRAIADPYRRYPWLRRVAAPPHATLPE